MAASTKAKTKVSTTAKKVTKKPTTVKRVVAKKKAKSVAAQPDFFEARFTDQTLYWLIFGAVAIMFALWLYALDAKVRDLYDQIDMNSINSSAIETMPATGSANQPAESAEPVAPTE